MVIDLRDTVVLVTGGSSGIGEAIAMRIGASGGTVALHYNSGGKHAHELAEQIGNGSASFQADFSDPMSASHLFDAVLAHFGRVDVLVNNAGIYFESPIELDEATWCGNWDRTMAVNLTAAAMLCRAAIRHFKERGGGRIVNIASRAAFRGETEHYLAYGASKGGMVSLSRSIARSFGPYNIKSFVIAPGWVRTPMTEKHLGEIEQELVEHELALNKLTETDDVAPVVVLIASGELDHATGCTIDINAGSYIR